MKKSSAAFTLGALTLAMALSATPIRAQAISAPIIVKSSNPNTNPKSEWLKGEVIYADAHSIIVRQRDNERMIHTFTIAPALKGRMQAIVDSGGYQYGDKVKILHQHGQTVALKVSGKPSKPS
ncbi:MAG TPA: hypothetical protein VEJ45_08280 [Candidatus Acidoferrales bacterium]|nr:hypothetical protein [Candidatus Acidoferrales bacterium]